MLRPYLGANRPSDKAIDLAVKNDLMRFSVGQFFSADDSRQFYLVDDAIKPN